jgi:hypothetical protein
LDPMPTLGGGRQTGIKALVRFAGSSMGAGHPGTGSDEASRGG